MSGELGKREQLLYFGKGVMTLVARGGPRCDILGKGRKFRDRGRDGRIFLALAGEQSTLGGGVHVLSNLNCRPAAWLAYGLR